jgi:hypothetical protein
VRGPLVVGVVSLAIAACTGGSATDQRATVEVVQAWTAARNAGDVDGVMALVSGEARLLEFSMQAPGGRDAFAEFVRMQAAADWEISEVDCTADGERVLCRYEQSDVFLRGVGVALTGTHEYVVRDGLILSVTRTHDSRGDPYDAWRRFRSWVGEHHPELQTVIWARRGSVGYSTLEGVEAMLSILDEYLASR